MKYGPNFGERKKLFIPFLLQDLYMGMCVCTHTDKHTITYTQALIKEEHTEKHFLRVLLHMRSSNTVFSCFYNKVIHL